MTAITKQLDESKERLNELRDDAVRKAKEVQRNIVKTRDLTVGRLRDTSLAAFYQASSTALSTAASIGGRVPGASSLEQTLSNRAKELDSQLEDLSQPPIENYDQLNVKQVADELEGLDAWTLTKIRAYEQENKNRKTVFAAIDRRLG